MNDVRRALLLIAHGSRRAEANADLILLADAVRARGLYHFVATAYLELAEPSIPQGAAACVQSGATDIVMLPYFLSPGRHVCEDLEGFRQQFVKLYPEATFRLAEPLGRHPLMIEIVLDRASL